MVALNKEALLEFLRQQEYDPKQEDKTGNVYVLIKIANIEFPLFFRIFEPQQMLQMLLFVPCTIDPHAFPELGRLLHLINKEIDVPGFCMDESANVIFYRCLLPAFDGIVNDDLFFSYLQMLPPLALNFTNPIASVATGRLTFDQVKKKIVVSPEQIQP